MNLVDFLKFFQGKILIFNGKLLILRFNVMKRGLNKKTMLPAGIFAFIAINQTET